MKAIVHGQGPLVWADVPTPDVGPGEVGVRVRATAVNRADLVQRAGHYAPPPGKSEILGLEAAGVVEVVGEGVTRWKPGDRVCALLAGGGYAEEVVCPAGHLLPIPEELSFVEAAALPEVVITAWLNLYQEAGLQPGERVLVHAGASGVGTAAIQLCRSTGNPVWVTVGSDEKLARCVELGAAGGANRKEGRWAEQVAGWTEGKGFDVILDPVGATYLGDDLASLAPGGRIVFIGMMGGRTGELDIGRLMMKRLRVIGSVLRGRSDAEKAAIVAQVEAKAWPAIEFGLVRPVVHAVLPIERAEEAHLAMAKDENVGKIVLTVGPAGTEARPT